METIVDVDKIMRAGQEIVRRTTQQFGALLGEALQPEIDRLGRVLQTLATDCDTRRAELTALEKRVQDAKARATTAEGGARAKQDEEAAIEQRLEAKRAEEKRLDGVLVNLRGSITTAAATV